MITRRTLLRRVKNNKPFSVTFVKKDGQERTMQAQMGVQHNLVGTGLAFDPRKKGLIGTFDIEANDYRFINLATVKEITANGKRKTYCS